GAGHDLVVETDGVGGRDRALAEAFDVILLDIQVPRITGADVCRELRAAAITTPVLALSASVMPDQVAKGLAAGFNDYLTKPLSTSSRRAAVREYGGAPGGEPR